MADEIPDAPPKSWLELAWMCAKHPTVALGVAVFALSLATACQLGINVPKLLNLPTAQAAQMGHP